MSPNLHPAAIVYKRNLTGVVADIAGDPDAPDGTWLLAAPLDDYYVQGAEAVFEASNYWLVIQGGEAILYSGAPATVTGGEVVINDY